MGKQNELSENLNNWDYISRYSLWMYHTYEKYVGEKVLDVGAGMGRIPPSPLAHQMMNEIK